MTRNAFSKGSFMQNLTILAPAILAVGEGGLKNRLHIYYSESSCISFTVSEIQNYDVIFEITIQWYDIHEPFSNIEGVKAEKRYQTFIKFYRQKVTE